MLWAVSSPANSPQFFVQYSDNFKTKQETKTCKPGLQLIMGYISLEVARELIYKGLRQGAVILLLFMPTTKVSKAKD